MQINFIRNSRINRLAAGVLLACCFFQLQAAAQSEPANERTKIGSPALIGFARGEMLRFTAFNPESTGERGGPIRMQMKLFDAQGTVIATSAEVMIPPGQFRFVDFNRDDLPITGDPDTGLLQVRTQPLWGVRAGVRVAVTTSLEVSNHTTGGSFKFFLIVEALP
ncbi:MAG TPA: hypothetical protein VF131_08795 [Blastocatellia bacterium]|nr:hypothetical protein [Blastocatellia bacterium]